MSKPNPLTAHDEREPKQVSAASIASGMAIGAGLGLVLWLTTSQFVFFPVFTGAGISIGTALDAAKRRKKSE